MRIGILSDTHSRYATVDRALNGLQGRGVRFVLHCGDIEDANTVLLFQGFTAHFVLGNCDHLQRPSLVQAIKEIGATLHEPFGHLELEGIKTAFLHGDDVPLLKKIEKSGRYDFLFYGHSHQAGEYRRGTTRIINPGALHRAYPKQFIVLDLATGEVESVVMG
jgi:putative phosphoesterase